MRGGFPHCREFFSKVFLSDAAERRDDLSRNIPPWFAYYASSFGVSDDTQKARLMAIEQILSRVGATKKRELKSRLLGSNGFQAVETIFEIAVLSAGLFLPNGQQVELYPKVHGQGNRNQEFAAVINGRKVFFEATCLRPDERILLPRSKRRALIGTNMSKNRVKDKLLSKQPQYSKDSPNVVFYANRSSRPEDWKAVPLIICQGIRNSQWISAAVVFYMNNVSGKFVHQGTEWNSNASFPLTAVEMDSVQHLVSTVCGL
jgi:hypothetical protein